jgi:F-type H+-transporting ATPase subunit delta
MATFMRGASAESQEAVVSRLQEAIGSGADGNRLADQLFAVAELLLAEPGLRRVLTDQSVDAEAKAGLVRQMFSSQLDAGTVEVVADAARLRWVGPRDLGYSLEHAGIVALVEAADRAGEGDRLEDELFGLGQLVKDTPQLRDALSDPARSVADKRALLRELLGGRVTPGALRLAELATGGSHRTVSVALDEYQKVAAAHRQRLVALVRVARPLGDQEAGRLATLLSRQYSRPVHLNTVVDPGVIGGVRIEIGDDVIDGTIANRIDDAHRRLAG